MRCFVTGGTGFVGRSLVQELVAQYGSENVVCLIPPRINNLEQAGYELLQTLHVRTISADIRSWQPAPQEIHRSRYCFTLLPLSIQHLWSIRPTTKGLSICCRF